MVCLVITESVYILPTPSAQRVVEACYIYVCFSIAPSIGVGTDSVECDDLSGEYMLASLYLVHLFPLLIAFSREDLSSDFSFDFLGIIIQKI